MLLHQNRPVEKWLQCSLRRQFQDRQISDGKEYASVILTHFGWTLSLRLEDVQVVTLHTFEPRIIRSLDLGRDRKICLSTGSL